MTATAKRVLISAAVLAGLLAGGLFVAQLGDRDGENSAVVDPTPSPSPSITSTSPGPDSPKAQVKEAYLRQWEVYARAVETLQPRGLGRVLTGKALEVVRQEVRDRRRSQTPLRVRVRHDLAVKIVNATTAVVDDRYVNHSVEFDPQTGMPTERDPNEVIHEVYTLKKVNGAWKVSAIVRQAVRQRKQ